MENIKRFLLLIFITGLAFAGCEDDLAGGDEPVIDRDATFTQMDQVARPAINTVFTSSANKNQFNTTLTANLGAQFGTAFVDRLNALTGGEYTTNLLGLNAQEFGTTLANDVLTVASNGPTTFFDGTNVLTGRNLTDDVIDIELILIFGGPNGDGIQESGADFSGLISDGVDSNDREFLSGFPYLAPPFE